MSLGRWKLNECEDLFCYYINPFKNSAKNEQKPHLKWKQVSLPPSLVEFFGFDIEHSAWYSSALGIREL